MARKIEVPEVSREALENAITALELTLESAEASEQDFQVLFEDNPVIFAVLGFSVAWSKPRLELPAHTQEETGHQYLEPDFIGGDAQGLAVILDLKLPGEQLMRRKPFRETFRAKIHEYVAQVSNYSRYFQDSANRQTVMESCGVAVQEHPDLIIIVGRDSAADVIEIHEQVRQYTNRLLVRTYDWVLASLRLHVDFTRGTLEAAAGLSLGIVLSTARVDDRNRRYIFDAGENLDRNRVSVYLDGRNRICFELTDENGDEERLRELAPAGQDLFSPFLLWCELRNEGNPSALRMYINGDLVGEHLTSGVIPISEDVLDMCMAEGADLRGEHTRGAEIGIFEVVAYQGAVSSRDRFKLWNYFGTESQEGAYTRFRHYAERKYMTRGSDRNLHQPDVNLRPILRIAEGEERVSMEEQESSG